MNSQLELILTNRLAEIARAQDQLEQFATAHRVPLRKLHELQVALEELLSNIIRHGYEDDCEHYIQIGIELTAGELRIRVQDDGRAFNPLQHPAPDTSIPLEQRPIGGLGIHMIRNSIDQVEYHRKGEKNIILMIKRV